MRADRRRARRGPTGSASTQSAKACASLPTKSFSGPSLRQPSSSKTVVADMAEIGFGLLHHRHVEEHAGLAQLVVGAEPADRAGRGADDRRRLLVPHALAIGPRADVDRILEHAGDAAIIFGRARTGRRRRRRSARLNADPFGSGGSASDILVVTAAGRRSRRSCSRAGRRRCAQIDRAILRLMLSLRRLPTMIAILCLSMAALKR